MRIPLLQHIFDDTFKYKVLYLDFPKNLSRKRKKTFPSLLQKIKILPINVRKVSQEHIAFC